MTDAMIRDALKRAKEGAEAERKDLAQKLLDYFRGLFDASPTSTGSGDGHTTALLKDIYKNKYAKMTPHLAYEPMVRVIADEIAKTFVEGMSFDVDDDDENETAKTTLLEILPEDWERVLKTIDPLKYVVKSPHIRVNWRDDKLAWDIVTPNVLDVVQDELDPTKAVALCVIQFNANTVSDTDTRYHVWTRDAFWIEDQHGKVLQPAEPNPYRELPFVACHDDYPLDSYFQPLPYDLVNQQERANILKTYLHYILAYADPMWVFMNVKETDNPTAGISEIHVVQQTNPDAKPEVFTVKPDADPEAYQRLLDAHISATRRAHGLQPYRDTGQVSSGIALKLENYSVLEKRMDAIEMWRGYLADLFRLSILVHNAHSKKQVSVDHAKIRFDFPDVEFPISRTEQLEAWEKELALGIKSPAEVLMEDNPDIETLEEAEERYQANMTATKTAKQSFSLQAMLNDEQEPPTDGTAE